MHDRNQLRRTLAEKICALSYSRLMEYGISRVADVTGLDTIGLPVWTACRPPGHAITISAGKGLTKIDSMAGAILEGAELWAAETPYRFPNWMHCSYTSIQSNVIPFDMMQLSHGSPVTESTPMAFEDMTNVFRDYNVLVPSDMIWMTSRVRTPFQFFQSTSNGLAAGVNEQDAILQATYEVIERDGWSISEFIQTQTGQWPKRVSLQGSLPSSIQFCTDKLRHAGVHPFLFDITQDIGVPIFRCTLLDIKDNSPGSFTGFGCSLNPVNAALRSITEACQARAAYVAGARDDLFRRKFILMKNIRMESLLDIHLSTPLSYTFSELQNINFHSIEQEWDNLSIKLNNSGITDIYSKTIYRSSNPEFSIVKVICPQLDCPLWEHSTKGKRALHALSEVT